MIGLKAAHPNDVTKPGAVSFYTFSNLHVHGRKTKAACLGVLRPKVVMDRKLQGQPGFEAFCYHEAVHAYEFHSLVGVLILLAGAVPFALALALKAWFLAPAPVLALVGWMFWKREAEVRADAVALCGAGEPEFYCMLQNIGTPKTWWGRFLYTRSMRERTARARRRMVRHGWQ